MADHRSLNNWIISTIQPHVRPEVVGDIYNILNLNGLYTIEAVSALDNFSVKQLFEDTCLTSEEKSHVNKAVLRLKGHHVESSTSGKRLNVSDAEASKANPLQLLDSEVDSLDSRIEEKKILQLTLKADIAEFSKPVAGVEPHGECNTMCGSCHRKGHRKSSCPFQECPGYYVCGIKEKHPEHMKKLSQTKKQLQEMEKEITALREKQVNLKSFQTNSELTFFRVIKPKLLQSSKGGTYQNNKNLLFKHMRLLRDALNGKLPPSSIDPEQLLSLISKTSNKVAKYTINTSPVSSDDEQPMPKMAKFQPLLTPLDIKGRHPFQATSQPARPQETYRGLCHELQPQTGYAQLYPPVRFTPSTQDVCRHGDITTTVPKQLVGQPNQALPLQTVYADFTEAKSETLRADVWQPWKINSPSSSSQQELAGTKQTPSAMPYWNPFVNYLHNGKPQPGSSESDLE